SLCAATVAGARPVMGSTGPPSRVHVTKRRSGCSKGSCEMQADATRRGVDSQAQKLREGEAECSLKRGEVSACSEPLLCKCHGRTGDSSGQLADFATGAR